MQVVVNSPPNFFDRNERRNFDAMMDAFENTHYTMKHNATMFWLTAFEKRLNEDDAANIAPPNSYVFFNSNQFYFTNAVTCGTERNEAIED